MYTYVIFGENGDMHLFEVAYGGRVRSKLKLPHHVSSLSMSIIVISP